MSEVEKPNLRQVGGENAAYRSSIDIPVLSELAFAADDEVRIHETFLRFRHDVPSQADIDLPLNCALRCDLAYSLTAGNLYSRDC